jgi:hypothetical protein
MPPRYKPPLMRLGPFLALCGVLLGGGCIIEAPAGDPVAVKARSAARAAPPLSTPLGANLGDKVELVGATIAPGRLLPGGQVKVTLALKVLATMEQDHLVFVHAEPVGGGDRMIFDHAPANGYATSKWKAGEMIRDEFVVSLPASARATSVNLWVGFWEPRTDSRLPLKNPGNVRNDGNGRIFLGAVPVAL